MARNMTISLTEEQYNKILEFAKSEGITKHGAVKRFIQVGIRETFLMPISEHPEPVKKELKVEFKKEGEKRVHIHR